MGVSLGNREFDRSFVRSTFKTLSDHSPSSVFVFLGDQIEAINYVVFRDMGSGEAKQISRARGESLGRMFDSAANLLRSNDILFQWSLESELRQSSQFGGFISDNQCILEESSKNDSEFVQMLDAQIFENLKAKEQRIGRKYIADNISRLRGYVLGELAVFFALFSVIPSPTEIYPGPNLFIKNEIMGGRFSNLRDRFRFEDYMFVDITSDAPFVSPAHE